MEETIKMKNLVQNWSVPNQYWIDLYFPNGDIINVETNKKIDCFFVGGYLKNSPKFIKLRSLLDYYGIEYTYKSDPYYMRNPLESIHINLDRTWIEYKNKNIFEKCL